MFHCISCRKEFENSSVNDMDFEFVEIKGRYTILYHKKCDACGGNLKAGFPKTEFINIGRDGDFKPFFSPDLGVYVDSKKKLNDTLKSRGMVNLNESTEYRQHEQMLQEKVMGFQSTKEALKGK